MRFVALFLFGTILCSSFYIGVDRFTDNFFFPKYFHTIFSSALFFIGASVYAMLKKGVAKFELNLSSLFLATFVLYIIVRIVVSSPWQIHSHEFYILGTLFILFMLGGQTFKNEKSEVTAIFFVLLFICGIVEVLYAAVQFANSISAKPLLDTVGTFSNPGPLSNYLSAIFPLALGVLIFRHPKKYANVVAGSFVALSVIILILVQARTAWLSVLCTTTMLLALRFRLIEKFKDLSSRLRIAVVCGAIASLAMLAIVLFSLKTDSAFGRLFIWKITSSIIVDHPLWGTGFGSYAQSYNDYQAGYFTLHPNISGEAMRADNMGYAYNEFLRLATELGLVGLIVFLGFVFAVFRKFPASLPLKEFSIYHVQTISKIGIAGILVSACFSYPFETIPVFALFFVYAIWSTAGGCCSVAQISLAGNYRVLAGGALIVLSLFSISQNWERYTAHVQWTEAKRALATGSGYGIEQYRELEPELSYYPLFLYNFGAELSVRKEYAESLEILKRAQRGLNDYSLYSYLGNSYEGIGNYGEAEKCFYRASKLVPHKMYAKYRLVYIYLHQDKMYQARNLAQAIIKFNPKVENKQSEAIKAEMKRLLKQLGRRR